MFSTNLTTQFGRIFANLLREYILLDGVISRDTLHLRASCVKCCVNSEKTSEHSLNNNNFLIKKSSNAALNSPCGADSCNTTNNNNNNNVPNVVNANTNSNNNIQLLFNQQQHKHNNKLQQCNSSTTSSGKSETALPSSSFNLAQVWIKPMPLEQKILDRQFEPKRTLNNEMQAERHFLNATTSSALQHHLKPKAVITNAVTSPTKSFLRAMSMLAIRPVTISSKTMDGPTFKVPRRWFNGPKIRNRDNCAEWCGEDVCNLNRIQTNTRKSMWVTSDCYKRCPKPFRYDVVFMPGSNKETREYQQTWIECPPIRIVKKPVCCFEPLCLPPICRRPRKPRGELPGKDEKHNTCGINACKIENDPRCIKVREPCCRVKARDKPCCIVYPTVACCQKRCTPYPSFSECCKPEANRKAPIECLCLVKPTMCEVWADWRKKNLPGQYEDL